MPRGSTCRMPRPAPFRCSPGNSYGSSVCGWAPVFCAHLVICLLALALFGSHYDHRGWEVDVALLIGTFAALYAVAELALRAAGPAEDAASGKPTGINSGVAQLPTSIARSPSR